MVDVAGKVGLAGQADRLGVCYAARLVRRSTVVAIRLVVPGIHHIRLGRGDVDQFIIEGIQNALIDLCSLRRCRGWEIVLDLLLQPVVGICQVSGLDHKLIIVNHLFKCGNRSLLINTERV